MEQQHFIEWDIIARKLKGELSVKEEEELRNWLEEDSAHREYFEKVVRMWDEPQSDRQPDLEKLIARFDRFASQAQPGRQRLHISSLFKYAAAAVLLLGIAGGLFMWKGGLAPEQLPVAVTLQQPITPGSPRASIILADGQQVDLGAGDDQAVVREENGAAIRMHRGTVAYEALAKTSEEVYHSIVIPRGGEYCLKLSDGSTVWLDSDTRLRFPVSFVGNERIVELEGEAYFEVAKDKSRPFIVRTSRSDIRVYGTAFNVSAYKWEKVQHTTLAEGQVGVIRNGHEYRLVPGQQARMEENSTGVTIKNVNADLYCSWHKGMLLFENERLEDIMDRLSNWYDVDIVFKDNQLRNLHFTGDLERYADFTDILELIGLTTNVKFEVKDRIVTVSPAEK